LNGESFFRPRRMSTRLLCVRGTKILEFISRSRSFKP
jgi:hypothetical protein